jgi:hypothetical protein
VAGAGNSGRNVLVNKNLLGDFFIFSILGTKAGRLEENYWTNNSSLEIYYNCTGIRHN